MTPPYESETSRPADDVYIGSPVLDVERYRARVTELGIADKDADEYLGALWFIMCAFVEFGQDVKRSTELLPFMRDLSSGDSVSAVNSGDTQNKIEHVAAAEAAKKDDS